MIQRWKNIPGQISLHVFRDEDGNLYDAETDRPLPSLLNQFVDDGDELIIEFNSTGFYDPGSMYGGYQNLGNPPDGEDERFLNAVVVKERKLPSNLQAEIFDLFKNKVDSVALEGAHEL